MWVVYAIFAFMFGVAVLVLMGAMVVTIVQIIWKAVKK